jgi:hypothetical protein
VQRENLAERATEQRRAAAEEEEPYILPGEDIKCQLLLCLKVFIADIFSQIYQFL